jgi:hypothetical protein
MDYDHYVARIAHSVSQELIDRVKATSHLKNAPRRFAKGVTHEKYLEVLIEHDLVLIGQERHPAGNQALLELARRLILLYACRTYTGLLAAEDDIINTMTKKAHDEVVGVEDALTFNTLADAQAAVKEDLLRKKVPLKDLKIKAPTKKQKKLWENAYGESQVRPKSGTKRPAKSKSRRK